MKTKERAAREYADGIECISIEEEECLTDGFVAGVEWAKREAIVIAVEGQFQIGCSATEATGVVRKTRECIANGIKSLGEDEVGYE